MPYAWENKPDVSRVDAYELYLWIQNSADLHRQQYEPINKNLTIKMAQGKYDHAKAAKLFEYLAESGAKNYYAEQVEGQYNKGAFVKPRSSQWAEMFPKKLRLAVAEELRDNWEQEYELGNFNNYIPKKYQAKPAKIIKRKSPARRTATARALGGVR